MIKCIQWKLYNSLIKLVTRLSLYSCMTNYDSNVIDLELMILVCAVFNLPWPGNLLFDQRSLTLIMHFFQIVETEIHESLMVPNTQNLRGTALTPYTHTHVNSLSTSIHLTHSVRYWSYIHTYRGQLDESSKSDTKNNYSIYCLHMVLDSVTTYQCMKHAKCLTFLAGGFLL